MAKKFGKFLLFTAAIGGAAAAAYYYFQKKDSDNLVSEDDDYDDFSEDLEDEAETGKKYVSLTPDTEESFVSLDKVAKPADKTKESMSGDKDDADVEEFFDEEDGGDEEPPIKDN
ncbi:MAG: hypothetical protein J1E03_00940 [Acetatifactor sp.]|nr:hypothetical protein [Acetatifactor sp.]